jgi:hypothetical protein
MFTTKKLFFSSREKKPNQKKTEKGEILTGECNQEEWNATEH